MTDLEAAYVQEPGKIEAGYIEFSTSLGLVPTHYEPAVGERCRVMRNRDGHETETGGAVEMVTPLRIALDGGGFQ